MGYQQRLMPGRKRRRWQMYRRIATTQERRLWDPEFGRPSRSQHALPDAWEDVHRGHQRSWKVHRKTQYRA